MPKHATTSLSETVIAPRNRITGQSGVIVGEEESLSDKIIHHQLPPPLSFHLTLGFIEPGSFVTLLLAHPTFSQFCNTHRYFPLGWMKVQRSQGTENRWQKCRIVVWFGCPNVEKDKNIEWRDRLKRHCSLFSSRVRCWQEKRKQNMINCYLVKSSPELTPRKEVWLLKQISSASLLLPKADPVTNRKVCSFGAFEQGSQACLFNELRLFVETRTHSKW